MNSFVLQVFQLEEKYSDIHCFLALFVITKVSKDFATSNSKPNFKSLKDSLQRRITNVTETRSKMPLVLSR